MKVSNPSHSGSTLPHNFQSPPDDSEQHKRCTDLVKKLLAQYEVTGYICAVSSDSASCLSKNTLGRTIAGISPQELQACWVDVENIHPSSNPVLSQSAGRAKVALTFCSLGFVHSAKQTEPDMRGCKAFAPHKLQAFPFSGAGAILPRY